MLTLSETFGKSPPFFNPSAACLGQRVCEKRIILRGRGGGGGAAGLEMENIEEVCTENIMAPMKVLFSMSNYVGGV